MNIQGWAEIVFTIGLAVLLGWPLGLYMARVWEGRSTWLDLVLRPVERLFYGLSGVDPDKGQTWVGYAIAMLTFNAVGFILLFFAHYTPTHASRPRLTLGRMSLGAGVFSSCYFNL